MGVTGKVSEFTASDKESIKRGLRKLKHTGEGSQSKVLKQIFSARDLPMIKEMYDQAGSFAKFFQMESLLSVARIAKRMEDNYWSDPEGKLDSQYHQLRKVLDTNASRIRRQEEGINLNVHGEISIHDDIRDLVKKSKELIVNAEVIERKLPVEPESGKGKDSEVQKSASEQ